MRWIVLSSAVPVGRQADADLPESELFEFLQLARRVAKRGCVVSYSHLEAFQAAL